MWNRIRAVFRAGFEAQWSRGAWPVAPLVMHGSIAAVMALLVRDSLPPFAYALFTLTISASLLALPLLGDFGHLLRADPAREWVEALPVRASELRCARTLLLLLLVGALSFSALLPVALLAPEAMSWPDRALLFVAGMAQATVVAAALLGVQSLLGSRAEALLVLIQTVLVGGVVVGCLAAPRLVPSLLHVTSIAEASTAMRWLPSASFATLVSDVPSVAWRSAPFALFFLAVLVLTFAPQSRATAGRRGGWLAFALAPLRALATRTWVRRAERGPFDLVFDALPLEREFVLRTYPMIAIPLAMLFAGSRGERGIEQDGLLAVLLFTPATYLPILLVHVPATSSPDARWILEGAPVARVAIDEGALKAITLRFVVPLYVVLFALAWSQAGFEFALRMAPIGFLVSVLVVRRLYAACVPDLPLSVDPASIYANMDWMGMIGGTGVGLTLVAIAALLLVKSLWITLAACAALVLFEWFAGRAKPVRS